jgi:molybdenum cofactor guanylyltransferase
VARRRESLRRSDLRGVYDRGMELELVAPPNVTAFVLAGGKSTRMGSDKAFVNYRGIPLLAHALDVARAACADVRIVGNRAKFARYGTVVEDLFPDRGPLAGIHAALLASQTDLNLMLAVDMPMVSSEFVKYLLGVAQVDEATVVVPRVAGRRQPLCAIYRPEFASIAEAALQAGRNKIDPLFSEVRIRTVEEEEVNQAGFHRDIFCNVNTPIDLEKPG